MHSVLAQKLSTKPDVPFTAGSLPSLSFGISQWNHLTEHPFSYGPAVSSVSPIYALCSGMRQSLLGLSGLLTVLFQCCEPIVKSLRSYSRPCAYSLAQASLHMGIHATYTLSTVLALLVSQPCCATHTMMQLQVAAFFPLTWRMGLVEPLLLLYFTFPLSNLL